MRTPRPRVRRRHAKTWHRADRLAIDVDDERVDPVVARYEEQVRRPRERGAGQPRQRLRRARPRERRRRASTATREQKRTDRRKTRHEGQARMETAAKSLTDRSHGPITPHAPPQFHKRAATVSLPRQCGNAALLLSVAPSGNRGSGPGYRMNLGWVVIVRSTIALWVRTVP